MSWLNRVLSFAIAVVWLHALPAMASAPDPLGGDSLIADVRGYHELGPEGHRVGSVADARVHWWILSELAKAGYTIGNDGYSFLDFVPRSVGLTIDGKAVAPVVPLLYSGVTSGGPVTAPLVDVGEGTPAEVKAADLKGKIAVATIPTALDNVLAPTLPTVMSGVRDAGAVGLIAATQGPADYPVAQDVDSRAGLNTIPTLLVGQQTGQAIKADASAGKSASLTLDADVGRACTANSYGVLPGKDPSRYVVIGTPTSAQMPAVAERGSGVAAMLALARHYAAVPQAQRPVSLVFVALSGHEVGFLGLPTFMKAHPELFDHADAYVHLGAALGALDEIPQPDGSVKPATTGSHTRSLYLSENPLLQPILAQFAQAQPIAPIAPSAFDPGEQVYAYHAGVPIVAMSGASYYFHTAGDQLSEVGPAVLASVTAAFRGAIDYVVSQPAGAIRSANGAAAQAGAARDPNPTPTPAQPGGSVQLPVPDAACAPPLPPGAPTQATTTTPALPPGSARSDQSSFKASAVPRPCIDRTPPRSIIDRDDAVLTRRRLVLSGRSTDTGCAASTGFLSRRGHVVRVAISVATSRHGTCQFLKPDGRLTAPRPCSHVVWLRATGTSHWRLSLRTRARPGSYRVRVVAVDVHGQRERPARRNQLLLRIHGKASAPR
jgi:Zn-dependent M28 family amino/carboxypeptidase